MSLLSLKITVTSRYTYRWQRGDACSSFVSDKMLKRPRSSKIHNIFRSHYFGAKNEEYGKPSEVMNIITKLQQQKEINVSPTGPW